MTIKINDLHEVKNIEKIVPLYLDAFRNYPKLMYSFPNNDRRSIALEASIRFYCAYDMKYGKAYSLDENVNDAAVLVESDKMKYSFFKHLKAGSYSREYRQLIKQLTNEEKKSRLELFEEMDEAEANLPIPFPHIYLDFLGVKSKCQGQGRGKKLMQSICRYSQERKLPIMLFTNTKEDVVFYDKLGFSHIGKVHFEKYDFTSWYMVK